MTTPSNPTIVLVHGAWADSSSWSPVIDRLRDARYPVRAIANPLQGLTSDTAHATSCLDTIDGPKVLVGHSYGGAIITNAATAVPEVKSPVYIAGFIPAKGETIAASPAAEVTIARRSRARTARASTPTAPASRSRPSAAWTAKTTGGFDSARPSKTASPPP